LKRRLTPFRMAAGRDGCRTPAGLELLLAVSGFGAVFSQVVIFRNVDRDSGFGSAQKRAPEGQPGDVLEDIRVFDSFGGALAPGKRGMASHKHTGDGDGVEALRSETANDDRAGIAYVGFSHFGGGEGLGDGNRTVKIVGVSGAQAGYLAAGLRPGGGELGVGVDNAADLGNSR